MLLGLPAALRRDLRGVDARLGVMEDQLAALVAREAELSSTLTAVSAPGPSGASTVRRDAVTAELGEHLATVRLERAAIVSRLDEARLELLRLKAGIGSRDDVLGAVGE